MKISTKKILKQLKEDLTGKDSHTGITLSYAWLANQYGHISLGFIPSFLLYQFFKINSFKSAVYVSLVWLFFEIYNYLSSFFRNGSSFKFKPKWGNVAFDTFTDVCFFAMGAFLFSLSISQGKDIRVIAVLIILGLYLLFASKYWFVTKMYQLYACFPFQFRLSQWSFDINEENKAKINVFLNSTKNDGNHLLIYGDFASGKTSLGVGILNELSIKHNSCLCKHGIKMFNAFFDENFNKGDEIWSWRTVDFLMIDDINPSKPIEEELVSPQKLLSFIDTFQLQNDKNRQTLINKNVIWVLGSKPILKGNNNDLWTQFLLEVGVDKSKVFTINLTK